MKLTPVVAKWSTWTFSEDEIAKAVKRANEHKWSYGGQWVPCRATVLDADGSRYITDAPKPAMNDAAWHAHLAQLKAARNKNVLPMKKRSG